MNNKERFYFIKAAQEFQNKYDPNNQASMREAYMNRGAGNQNMSFTPGASTLPGNFGFSNQQDFNRAAGLTGKLDGGNLLQTGESPWKGVSPQMRQSVMDMRRSMGGHTRAQSGFEGKFTAPETQTRYNGGQPGGSNYYHGLHHMNTDEFGDHKFSSPPQRTNANFQGEGGQEKFDQALSAYNDGVDNYNDYGSFQAPDNPPDLLAQRLQESGGNLGSTDYLTQRLNEQGMNSKLPGTPVPPSQPNTSSNSGAMLASQVPTTTSGNTTASMDPKRQAVLDQAKSRGLQLSPDGKSWVPMQ